MPILEDSEPSKLLHLILGPPLSGKSTQAQNLAKDLNFPCLSVAQIMASHISKRTALGKTAQISQVKNNTIDDKIINQGVQEHIQEGYLNSKGLILEGYPRNLDQYVEMKKIVQALGFTITSIFYLDVPDDILANRFLKNCPDRYTQKNFNQKVRNQRISFLELLAELDLQNSVIKIDGRGSVASVYGRIKEKVK